MSKEFVALLCLATIIGSSVGQKEYTLNNGRKIPNFGLRTALATNLENVVKEAVNAGYRLIDTTFIYKNEADIGKALKTVLQEGTVKREDLFVVSKLIGQRHRPSEVLPTIKETLRALQLEYIDLYLMHWPFALQPEDKSKEDKSVTIEDTWRAMEELVKQNYTKSIGLTNFNSQQIERILKIATIKPVANQVECHPYMSQEKLRKFCKEKEIFVIAYSPLLFKAGSWNNSQGLNLFTEPVVEELSHKYKKTPVQIILRYLVQIEVIPIPKTDKLEHLHSNINIFDFVIIQEDFEKMKALNKNLRLIEALYYSNFTEYPFKAEF